jgi:hypothetical protein
MVMTLKYFAYQLTGSVALDLLGERRRLRKN